VQEDSKWEQHHLPGAAADFIIIIIYKHSN
jgi:hypothetical protein